MCTLYESVQHAVTVVGEEIEPKSNPRSYGLSQTRLKSTGMFWGIGWEQG